MGKTSAIRMITSMGKPKELNKNSDNPYEEWVYVTTNRGGTKLVKQKRPLPVGLSDNDGKVLKAIRKKAYKWDMKFRCCGYQFGWSAIIGLIPVLGDALEVLISLSLLKQANTIDGNLGWGLWLQMFGNIMFDFAAGFVPVLGDLLDFWYRANTRNAWLLDNLLTKRAEENRLRAQAAGAKGGMQYAPDGRDLELGMAMAGSAYATPAVVPPARTPAPRAQNSPAPYRSTPPGRSLTGQRTPNPGQRTPQDPRDRGYR